MPKEFLNMGGAVLVLILLMGLFAFGVFVERSLHLHRARIKAEDFLKGIMNILHRGNISEALAICEDTPGPVSNIVRISILHRNEGREAIRSFVDDAGLAETSRMERRLVLISTTAQVAPLLGLLGTIIGLLKSVLVMQGHAPLIQSADVLDGLMAALITTGAGLMVAIPCYVAFNILVVKIDRLVVDMERAGAEMLAFLTSTDVAPTNGNPHDQVIANPA